MGYLDNAGLAHLWGKVKSALAGKQDALTPDGSITLQGGGIGVALPTKSVTRAEYDAMTEAEKQAEAVYLVGEPAWEPVPLSVQEYDTEDGWHVRKWSDGYVSLELVFTISPQDNGLLMPGLQRGIFPLPELQFPLLVQYSNQISIIGHAGNNIVWVANDTNEEMFSIVGNGLPSTVTFSYVVTGRWK